VGVPERALAAASDAAVMESVLLVGAAAVPAPETAPDADDDGRLARSCDDVAAAAVPDEAEAGTLVDSLLVGGIGAGDADLPLPTIDLRADAEEPERATPPGCAPEPDAVAEAPDMSCWRTWRMTVDEEKGLVELELELHLVVCQRNAI